MSIWQVWVMPMLFGLHGAALFVAVFCMIAMFTVPVAGRPDFWEAMARHERRFGPRRFIPAAVGVAIVVFTLTHLAAVGP
jgi:hypothetical protein